MAQVVLEGRPFEFILASEKILEGRHVHRGFYYKQRQQNEQRHGPELIGGTKSSGKKGAQRNEAGKVGYGSNIKAFELKTRFRLYVTGIGEL